MRKKTYKYVEYNFTEITELSGRNFRNVKVGLRGHTLHGLVSVMFYRTPKNLCLYFCQFPINRMLWVSTRIALTHNARINREILKQNRSNT